MPSIRWEGREITPAALVEAAREARRQGWLDPDDRRFLHGAGLALAAERPLGPAELLRLDLVLTALHRLGWRDGGAAETGTAGRTPQPVDNGELASLRAEVGRLTLMLAAANERLEACRRRLERFQRGLPDEPDLPWLMGADG